ncbi:MAG: hypothetical protein JWP13_16 [Candidatus Saccharibacteria bacterium]|nr:hypothetical protein [Candidatus Saccharibacteria bacterium]
MHILGVILRLLRIASNNQVGYYFKLLADLVSAYIFADRSAITVPFVRLRTVAWFPSQAALLYEPHSEIK